MSVAFQAAGVAQVWHKKKICPLSEDMSRSRLQPNVARRWCPSLVIRGTCHAVDIGQMWQKNDVPCWRTLFHCRLWSNVVQNVPLIGGHYLSADFDQMWSKMCLLSEDFVSLQTSTKYGPKCAPCRRTLSHCGLQPDVIQTCAPHWRTLSCWGLQPNVVQTCAPQRRTSFATKFNHIWINNVLIIKKSQYQTSGL